jgi:acyl-CoA reductase-like NAD-dependent aldehyde dehydrogenase
MQWAFCTQACQKIRTIRASSATRHYGRLEELLADAKSRGARFVRNEPAGENFDPAQRKLAPAIVLEVNDEMRIMREEIFGPVLPVVCLRQARRCPRLHQRP